MKEYVRQFYNEGLGLTFCQKPIKYLNKKIKNNLAKKILKNIILILYTILVIIFAIFMFIKKWPI